LFDLYSCTCMSYNPVNYNCNSWIVERSHSSMVAYFGPFGGILFLFRLKLLLTRKFWFLNCFSLGFKITLENLFLVLLFETTSTLSFRSCFLTSSSIRRRVIIHSRENFLVLYVRRFLKSFQAVGSISIITIIWNCSWDSASIDQSSVI